MKSSKKEKMSSDHLAITGSTSVHDGRLSSLPIPIDIILIIFSKLDLKSLALCRCVSKIWASILRRPDFTELFLSMSCPKLLFVCRRQDTLLYFSAPQPQNQDKLLSPIVPKFLMEFPFSGWFKKMVLVHGLICLDNTYVVDGIVETSLRIFNPSTGQVLVLPDLKSKSHSACRLLGYDPVGKQFKLLSMSKPINEVLGKSYSVFCEKHQVLSLGTENVPWRMIECPLPHHPPDRRICINGVLFYVAVDWYDTTTCLVVCFNVRSEKFSFIKTPDSFNAAIFDTGFHMINFNGKLSLIQVRLSDDGVYFFAGRDIMLKLWVLEDNEKQKWCEHTFVFSTMPDDTVKKVILRFVGFTKKQEIVLMSSKQSYLLYLNLEKNTIEKVKIGGIGGYLLEQVFLDHVEDVKIY